LLVHGRQDSVVPLSSAHQTHESLLSLQVPVTYSELNMGHEIPPQVLQLMQSFIEERGSAPDSPAKPL
jgi:phospholipase/carboxylesterase